MPTPSDAVIFQMASQISKEHPEISIPTAISIAAKLLPATNGRTISTTSSTNKPKTKRGKNAYMFYLDSVRAEIKADLLATAQQTNPDAKVKVSEVTKVAGSRWKQLEAADKLPFENMAAEAKARLNSPPTADTTATVAPAAIAATAPAPVAPTADTTAPVAPTADPSTTTDPPTSSPVTPTPAPVAPTNEPDTTGSTQVTASPPVPPA